MKSSPIDNENSENISSGNKQPLSVKPKSNNENISGSTDTGINEEKISNIMKNSPLKSHIDEVSGVIEIPLEMHGVTKLRSMCESNAIEQNEKNISKGTQKRGCRQH